MAEAKYLDRGLNQRILGCAIKVHRALGPGLLESAYRTCLVHELERSGLAVRTEVPIEIRYDGIGLQCGYRADIIVQESVLIELKAVDRLASIHDAQLLTYLKLSGIRVGFLLNFNATSLRQGIRRLVR